MIEFNEVFCLDLKDDFEELGRGERNFELEDLIKGDLSRAFAFGYCYTDWKKEKMWFPVSIRKKLRHIGDNLQDYHSQIKWLNDKYGATGDKVKIEDYASYILENVFCEDSNELLKLAIVLGINLRLSSND